MISLQLCIIVVIIIRPIVVIIIIVVIMIIIAVKLSSSLLSLPSTNITGVFIFTCVKCQVIMIK